MTTVAEPSSKQTPAQLQLENAQLTSLCSAQKQQEEARQSHPGKARRRTQALADTRLLNEAKAYHFGVEGGE